jgi:hypothetical protein
MLAWFILLVYSYTISTYLLIDGTSRFQFISNMLSTQVEYEAYVFDTTRCNMTYVADGIVNLQDIPTEFGYINNCGRYFTPNYTYLYTTNTSYFVGYELLIVGPSCTFNEKTGMIYSNGIIYTEIVINCLVGVALVLFCVGFYANISNLAKHRLSVVKYIIIIICCAASIFTLCLVLGFYVINHGGFSGEERNFLYVILIRIVGIYCMGVIIHDFWNVGSKNIV